MRCLDCGKKMYVMDTRHGRGETYRRLRCMGCGVERMSVEYIDDSEDTRQEYLTLKKKEIFECMQRKAAKDRVRR